MIEYKKFLETKQENVYLNCSIEKPYQLHEGITFELKGSIKISKQDCCKKDYFLPKEGKSTYF